MGAQLKKKLQPRNLKLTVVGDKKVGKTCLLKTYCTGSFPKGDYASTVFPFISDDDYVFSKPISYNGSVSVLALWDRVYNRAEDEMIRSLQYDQTDVFLLCFSLADKQSFLNAVNVWRPEIQKHCPKTPFLLVGLKKDLRSSRPNSRRDIITKSMGIDMAQRIGAVAYAECSAKRKENLKEVFAIAVQTAMHCPPPKPKNKAGTGCGSRLLRFMKLM